MKTNQTARGNATWIYLAALALAIGLMPALPAHAAGKQAQPATSAAQMKNSGTKAKIYVGVIEKVTGGRYALIVNQKTHRGWYVNDPAVAKKYVGKRVDVRGVLNRRTMTLKVLSMRPARG